MANQRPKILLIILDGFGLAPPSSGNAISLASPEFLNFAVSKYPSFVLTAAGPFVGLPWGEPGNSEVGHTALGTGRIVEQNLSIISRSIKNGEFFKKKLLLQMVKHIKKYKSKLHIAGLISPGGIHAYDEHAVALVKLAKENDIKEVYIHMFSDGEDMPKDTGIKIVEKLEKKFKEIGVGKISTIIGREIAMDRIENWDKTEKTFKAMVLGEGEKYNSAKEVFEKNYKKGIYDSQIEPSIIVIDKNNPQRGLIEENDALIFINYRPERIAQIAQFFDENQLSKIRPNLTIPKNLFVATMTEYKPDLKHPIIFPPLNIKNTFGEIMNNNNISQLRIAEKEKFAHVTIFINGSLIQYPSEERICVTSKRKNGVDYTDNPEMSAEEITDIILKKYSNYDVFIINYANADMLGHSGNIEATIKAVQTIDKCLKRIYDKIIDKNFIMIITADHGNAEEMINLKTKETDTKHSTNPIPLIFINKDFKNKIEIKDLNDLALQSPIGTLSDVAPTILDILNIKKPKEMTGVSLYNMLK